MVSGIRWDAAGAMVMAAGPSMATTNTPRVGSVHIDEVAKLVYKGRCICVFPGGTTPFGDEFFDA